MLYHFICRKKLTPTIRLGIFSSVQDNLKSDHQLKFATVKDIEINAIKTLILESLI